MIDFNKVLEKTEQKIAKDPLEIYESLDRKSTTGPLRPTQEKILKEWYKNRKKEKDLIIKLHTGEGKTLIGLLILMSKINSKEGPCLYVCPNIYLMQQVSQEAEKFGIPYCIINDNNEIPEEFTMGKSILITYAQKIFNGKSIFGIGGTSVRVGCIILDDSHACIDTINDAFTINVTKEKNKTLYNDILKLFEEDLMEQGEGTYLDIVNEEFESILPIPYWAWNQKKSELLKLLASNKNSNEVKFAWELLKDRFDKCKGFISGSKIEISPYYIPIELFGTFNYANNRILMSATTQNDSFFINGLGLSVDSIKNPLVDLDTKWSGEKMILIPSMIREECGRDTIISSFAKKIRKKFGIVAITSSGKQAKIYEKYGAKVCDSSNIFTLISDLKNGSVEDTVVIANRYDGIDLPDESCRLLIIDSLPFFDTLKDRYEKNCRPNSEVINRKIAQKIEQGLGRSVRGKKDYSIILIIGSDLVKFVKGMNTKKYFSSQTQQQIEIGLSIAELSKEGNQEGDNPISEIIALVKQCLNRDTGWKSYYEKEMDKVEDTVIDMDVYNTLKIESDAERYYYNGNFEKASKCIKTIIDNTSDSWEKGWYLQKKARFIYNISQIESNKLQISAFTKNNELLKPRDGITYNKISYINQNRINRIKQWIGKYKDYSELIIQVDSILDDLSFGREAEKFEKALDSVGKMLGFKCQRPDKMIRKGPDNLWCIENNKYIMFECKSEVKDDRKEISKYEAGQFNSHCGWFEEEYNDAEVTRYLIIPTKELSYQGNFTHDVTIIRKNKLKTFKSNIKSFIKEFKDYNLRELNDKTIQEWIDINKLDIESLKTIYSEPYYTKKS